MRNRIGLAGFATVLALSLLGGTATARDKERATEFDVHVGDTFIYGIGLPAVDIAGASNGDTIGLLFTGRIDAEGGEAQGKGAFQHFDKSGKLVDWGTFTAKRLISFTDLAPATGFPPTWHRGLATIQVRAVGQTTTFDATLGVNCKFGPAPPPPPDYEEGTTFAVSGGLNFNMNVNDINVFNLFVAAPED